MSRNLKYSCGVVVPSGCVPYTGDFPGFVDQGALECNPNLDKMFELYGAEIDAILAQIDLKALNKERFAFDPDTVSVHALFQETINKVSDLEETVEALQTLVEDKNISSKEVVLDLKCMKPVTNICGLPTDHYTLTTVLNILVNEICNLKSKL